MDLSWRGNTLSPAQQAQYPSLEISLRYPYESPNIPDWASGTKLTSLNTVEKLMFTSARNYHSATHPERRKRIISTNYLGFAEQLGDITPLEAIFWVNRPVTAYDIDAQKTVPSPDMGLSRHLSCAFVFKNLETDEGGFAPSFGPKVLVHDEATYANMYYQNTGLYPCALRCDAVFYDFGNGVENEGFDETEVEREHEWIAEELVD